MGTGRALAIVVGAGVVMMVVVIVRMTLGMIMMMVVMMMPVPIAFDAHFAFAATAHVTHSVFSPYSDVRWLPSLLAGSPVSYPGEGWRDPKLQNFIPSPCPSPGAFSWSHFAVVASFSCPLSLRERAGERGSIQVRLLVIDPLILSFSRREKGCKLLSLLEMM